MTEPDRRVVPPEGVLVIGVLTGYVTLAGDPVARAVMVVADPLRPGQFNNLRPGSQKPKQKE